MKLESNLVSSIELGEMKLCNCHNDQRMVAKTHKDHKSDERHLAALARASGI